MKKYARCPKCWSENVGVAYKPKEPSSFALISCLDCLYSWRSSGNYVKDLETLDRDKIKQKLEDAMKRKLTVTSNG
jgi:predicted nucleic-acid-binding Zn-ribbon protein